MGRMYRVGEVAALTGVSVRTLHHYDQIGLLRPSGHSEAGYRLYAGEDVLRLQQVLTLRYLGFPLRQIGALLHQPELSLVASIQAQRQALRDRVAELERVEAVLGDLLAHRQTTGAWAWEKVIKAVALVQDGLDQKGATMERIRSYYTPEELAQFEELARRVPAEERAAIEQGWPALLADVRANRHLDPASPEAKALADRWDALTERLQQQYAAFPELWQRIGENYQAGRFEGVEGAPQTEDVTFIERVKAARSASSASLGRHGRGARARPRDGRAPRESVRRGRHPHIARSTTSARPLSSRRADVVRASQWRGGPRSGADVGRQVLAGEGGAGGD